MLAGQPLVELRSLAARNAFFPHRFFASWRKRSSSFPLGWIVTAGGAFKVRRGEQDEEAIATAVELARSGTWS